MTKINPNEDPECHVLYFRGLSRLHEETMDLFRLQVPKLEGTINGANYNQMMKYMLHHDAVGAISFIQALTGQEIFEKADKCLKSYLEALPESENECCIICYNLLSRESRDAILMMSIPNSITSYLKTMSGGRWMIERLEAKLWSVVNNRS